MIAVPDELETVDVGEWHARVERAHCDGFAMFDWLTAVDRMDSGTPGFDVVVRLIALPEVNSATGLRGIRLTARVADGQSLASITDLYAGAAWHERETFEMFGVFFDGFADHKGYGTPVHLAALRAHGPCEHHRRSFAPVRQVAFAF